MIGASSKSPPAATYYFVCATCNAKWFAAMARARCPRCDARALSGERQTPPWLRHAARPKSD